jgi:hypothetical protein
VTYSRISIRISTIAAAVCLLFLAGGCASKYYIGYALDPLDGPPVKYKTPVQVRNLADRRPVSERFEPEDFEDFRFHSSDLSFKQPVAPAITRALQLELANAGIEVADAGNYIPGEKPYLRILGDILHFVVTRQEIPVDTMQHDVKTLWHRERFTVKVSINIEMIDTLQKKRVMERTYTSKDSLVLRTDMINAVAYETGVETPALHWQTAGNEYCVQLLNEHLKRVLVDARKDIVKLLTPGVPLPESDTPLLDIDPVSIDAELSI